MGSEQVFWNYVYQLQQQGILCDMQLGITDSAAALPAHRLVMLASSAYYQTSLAQDDFQDTYIFDGLKEDSLQLLVDYCYRQITWSELTENAEAAVAAQTLELVQHPEPEPESSADLSTSQGDSEYPEMVVVQVDSSEKDVKHPINVKEVQTTSKNLQTENKCDMADTSCNGNETASSAIAKTQSLHIKETEAVKSNLTRSKGKKEEGDLLYKTSKEVEKVGNWRKVPVSPKKLHCESSGGKRLKSTAGSVSRLQSDEPGMAEKYVDGKESYEPKTITPERSSKRIRKRSSKFADYEEVPVFTPSKRQKLKEEGISVGQKSTMKGRSRKTNNIEGTVQWKKVHSPEKGEEFPDFIEEGVVGGGENKGVSRLRDTIIDSRKIESKKISQTELSAQNDLSEVIVAEVTAVEPAESQEIPIVITLEPGKQLIYHEAEPEDGEIDDENRRAGYTTEQKKTVKQESFDDMNPECEVCGGIFKSLTTCIAHEKRDHKHHRTLSCAVCSKSFKEKRQLIRHLTEVHNKNSFSCDHCNAQFKSREGLAMHKKKKHTEGSLSVHCDECEKNFFSVAELKSHKTFKHSTERNEACDSCHRTFKTKSLLKRHKNTYHSSERKHMCDLCGATFKTVSDMRMHRKKHYKEDGTFVPEIIPRSKLMYPPGDYPCRYCGKVFSKFHVRGTHERTIHIEKAQGNLFICTICNKNFPIKQSLMNHIKNRHLPRKYECPGCHLKFVTHKELVRHVENPERCKGSSRETRKQYWCNECQRGFTLKGNLTKHLQRGNCLRNKKVTTNYVVVLQKTGESDNATGNQKLEKIIALDEGFEKMQDIVETYKENSMIEVELLNEESVEHLDEEVVNTVEIVDQQFISNIGELEDGQEIILQQQEDGTMIIPYTSSDGRIIQTLNLNEIQQAALEGGENVEIVMSEYSEDMANTLGSNVQIHVAESTVVFPDGESIQGELVSTDGIQIETESTNQQVALQETFKLECAETDVETDNTES